jgi:hypothetical protein
MIRPQHFVQYGGSDEALLARNVAAYIAEGLRRDQPCIVAATEEHRDAFARELKQDAIDDRAAIHNGSLVFLDAREIAAALLDSGTPSRSRFDEMVGEVVRGAIRAKRRAVRVYGEIVGIYWSDGRHEAAVQLEHLWNELLRDLDFSLYCGYPIGVFDGAFTSDALDDLMCAHGKVISGVEDCLAEQSLAQAFGRVLGNRASLLRDYIREPYHPHWSSLPKVEAMVLWLRNNLRDYAADILSCAEEHYQLAVGCRNGA